MTNQKSNHTGVRQSMTQNTIHFSFAALFVQGGAA